MEDRTGLWYALPRPVRELPADLAAVVGLVGLTLLAVFLPGVNETPLRVVIGLPFVLFVPGYALIAALFPEAGASPDADGVADAAEADPDAPSRTDRSGIDGIERVALSFGLSIAVVPLLGLVLNFTPWGIRLVPIMVAVSGFTLVATAVAAIRRWELPAEERFRVPYRSWVGSARAELFEPETRVDAALNVLLVASILLAVGSVGYAVAVPNQGESFTEFYLLTHNETGDLVADDYPTEFRRGETRTLVVGIGNHEHRELDYTVVTELQRVAVGNNTTTVLEERELRRFTPTVGDNETWRRNHTVRPTMTGERLRLAYLLYRGDAPPEPTVENAYRELHLWVNVSATDGENVTVDEG
jgi:uncharacterized membrane protein